MKHERIPQNHWQRNDSLGEFCGHIESPGVIWGLQTWRWPSMTTSNEYHTSVTGGVSCGHTITFLITHNMKGLLDRDWSPLNGLNMSHSACSHILSHLIFKRIPSGRASFPFFTNHKTGLGWLSDLAVIIELL